MHHQVVFQGRGAPAEAEVLAHKILIAGIVRSDEHVLAAADVDQSLVASRGANLIRDNLQRSHLGAPQEGEILY